MIQRVWERCLEAEGIDEVFVATDDERIQSAVEEFGGNAVMTPAELTSGTERMAYLARTEEAEMYINVQGDEPLLPPSTIERTLQMLAAQTDADIATAACPLHDASDMQNPNIVKLVTDRAGFALYFSRAAIPHLRDAGNENAETGVYRKHVGIYAFRRDALLRFADLPPSQLERTEKLEQLRALEYGMRIAVADVERDSQAVDTPGDIAAVERLLHAGNTD